MPWVFGSGNELSTTETRCESLGAASGCFRDDWACECAAGFYGENCAKQSELAISAGGV